MDNRDVTTDASADVTYALDSRLQMSGDVALVLRLYRGQGLAGTSTLMVCDRQHMPDAIRVCRLHLAKLGVAERWPLGRQKRTPAASPQAA